MVAVTDFITDCQIRNGLKLHLAIEDSDKLQWFLYFTSFIFKTTRFDPIL